MEGRKKGGRKGEKGKKKREKISIEKKYYGNIMETRMKKNIILENFESTLITSSKI